MAKQIIKWAQVLPGDIISFKYKSEKSNRTLMQSVLVLNPKIDVKLKSGIQKTQMVGLKLEESNRSSVNIKSKLKLLETVGDLQLVDEENKIYRVAIKPYDIISDTRGVKESFYKKIKSVIKGKDIYRVYNWDKIPAMVYLEPIVLNR
jgi:hypothetical protein|tara:strand:- start:3273 stop:3716 length:444 start_codon:yes stop_codon:yes gene_type:complete